MSIRALGDTVLVDGRAELWLIKYALNAGVRERRRNGQAIDPMWTEALAALDRALDDTPSMSAIGHADVRNEGDPASSGELITTDQAAAILAVSNRQIRRLAATLDGSRAGRAWVFTREAVEHYRSERDRGD